MKLLIVDDHPLFTIGLGLALQRLPSPAAPPIKVQSASTVAQGLMAAAAFSPDIVLLDFHMPQSSGIEALRAFAQRFPWIARVVISGDERAEIAALARAHGASGWVSKASPVDELRLALDAVAAGGEWWPRPDAAPASSSAADRKLSGFTLRQLEVLRLLADGMNNRQIADALSISERTIKQHVSDMLARSGTSNRVQLLNAVRSGGLLG